MTEKNYDTFNDTEKKNLQKEIDDEKKKAERLRLTNSGYYIGSKVFILVISLATTVCSIIATQATEPLKTNFTVSSAILAAAVTAYSGFAFTDFDFGKRLQIYRKKRDSLINLHHELRFFSPEKKDFLRRYNLVLSWGDHTPLDVTNNGLEPVQQHDD